MGRKSRAGAPRRRSGPGARPLGAGGFGSRAGDGDDAFQVRTVPGSSALKLYRCPACHQVIEVGMAHVVVWPSAAAGGVSERRHWHTGCWRREASRRGL
ncbi:hypothetical protein [Tsukamurella soli]|uniref:ATP/GTP-binding protein n=1 Tax=Tsukamurella soli TaxID=644556 RepID=A0ABP8J9B5_9ACTN